MLSDKETLHVQNGAGCQDQLSAITLGDVSILVTEQNGWRSLQIVVVQLVESLTFGSFAIPHAPYATSPH